MAKQLKAAILARRAAKAPRKKRTRPKPRQYTIADWERARDRVAAAERRIDNDRTNNPNWGRAGLERAQLELSVITSQLRLRGQCRSSNANGLYGQVLPKPMGIITISQIHGSFADSRVRVLSPQPTSPVSGGYVRAARIRATFVPRIFLDFGARS